MFLSSVVAKSFPGYGAYIASKEGVEGLTRVLANELGERKITVNALAPGPVATELFLKGKSDEQIGAMAKMVPLGRIGQKWGHRGRCRVSREQGCRLDQRTVDPRQWRFRLRGSAQQERNKHEAGRSNYRRFKWIWRACGKSIGRVRPHRLRDHARHRGRRSGNLRRTQRRTVVSF